MSAVRGYLFIVSSPSGGGKTTLIRRLMSNPPGQPLHFSVSHTTRPMRDGEADGREYHFVSAAQFEEMARHGEFLEHNEVHGNFYGTAKSEVLPRLAAGEDVVLDIDVQGARDIRNAHPEAISIFIVPTSSPGFSWQPLHTMPGVSTFYTFYDNVRVPANAIVAGENQGWQLITTQLNNERVMLGPAGRFASIYDRIHTWASKPGGNGVTPIDHEDVRRSLGEIHAIWRINELLNWQVAAGGDDINVADAASTKVFGTERVQYVGRLAEEIVGKYGNPAETDTAELLQWLDSQTKRNLVITFGGGVNEVMREMIAASGLKVPRVPR